MDASNEFKPLRDAVQSTLVSVTRAVNTLANEDLQFQRTVHPSVATRLDQNTDRLLKLASGILKSAGTFTAQREVQLEDVDDVEIQWKGVVDVIDTLLEKSDTCLDEYTGLIKRKDAPTAESVCPSQFLLLPPLTDCALGPRPQTVQASHRQTRLVAETCQHPQAPERVREEDGQPRVGAMEALIDNQAPCPGPDGCKPDDFHQRGRPYSVCTAHFFALGENWA
jgi:hypothetical protein